MTTCEYCDAKCCKELMINLNPYDVAKILDQLGSYTITAQGVKHKGRKVIIINNKMDWKTLKEQPNPHLNTPCYFLENNKCTLHEKNANKKLNETLTKIGINTKTKPMICRHHPEYYDTEEKVTLKFKNCSRPNIYEIELNNNEELKKEAIKTEIIIEKMLKHYEQTGEYPIIEIAEELLNGKTQKLEQILNTH